MDRQSGAQELTHLPSPLGLSLLLLAILFWFVNQCTHGIVLGHLHWQQNLLHLSLERTPSYFESKLSGTVNNAKLSQTQIPFPNT
jgi:hypothetical protein